MTQQQRAIVESMIRSATTAHVTDRYKQLAAINYGKKFGIENEVKQMVLDVRTNWLNWWAMTQRKWQSETKNKNKARHHDSIAIREKYVICKQY